MLAIIALGIAACALYALRLGLPRSRPEGATPSPFLEKFSPKDYLTACFPNAEIRESGNRGLEKHAAWWSLRARFTASGPGLEDGNAVSGAMGPRLKAAIEAAVGPTKMASSSSGGYTGRTIDDRTETRDYVFEPPTRCVGHVTLHALRATAPPADEWIFILDIIEVPQ